MSEDVSPVRAGWYPAPEGTGSVEQVRYWDGDAWTGEPRRADSNGNGPRDAAGILAISLLAAGFVLTIALPVLSSVFAGISAGFPVSVFSGALLVILALSPAAIVVSIVGLVRGHEQKFHTPLSLVTLILAVLGTVILALPIALFTTGVWAIHI